ncbi:MAG: carboxymuconolactone decarboxylase family protein [Planctomycetota bacterium]|jgi:AhpD family alkylhydroperoxidase
MMDVKIKELIAIGASVSANCHPCLKFHVSKALENGVNDDEIQEAVSIVSAKW